MKKKMKRRRLAVSAAKWSTQVCRSPPARVLKTKPKSIQIQYQKTAPDGSSSVTIVKCGNMGAALEFSMSPRAPKNIIARIVAKTSTA